MNVRAALGRARVLVDLAVGVAAAVVLTNLVRLRTRVPRADPSAVVYEDPTIVRITFIVCLVVITPFVAWALTGGRYPLALAVLQVLALDIGTDILPALALGAEPPGPHLLEQPPVRRHLLDRRLFARAFGVLGPVEAAFELLAFVAVFLAAGWRPGEPFPVGSTLLAASGAAFTAVVLAQVANAFACRSTVRPAWSVGRASNRLLLGAVGAELVMLVGFLFIGPVARLLGQAPPGPAGLAVGLAAMPALLAADAVQKAAHRRRRSRLPTPAAQRPVG